MNKSEDNNKITITGTPSSKGADEYLKIKAYSDFILKIAIACCAIALIARSFGWI